MDIPYSKSLTMQSAAAATGNGTVFDVSDFASLGLQVSGTFVGTITFEATLDRTNYVAVQVVNANDGGVVTTATAPGLFGLDVSKWTQVRARVSAFTSGTITVVGFGSTAGGGQMTADIDVAGAEVVSLGAGEAHVGQVGGEGLRISQTPTVTVGAYSANDAVGGLLTFANAARVSAGSGVIKDVILIDDAGQDAIMELWLFSQTFTAMSDNAAWAPSEAEDRKSVV